MKVLVILALCLSLTHVIAAVSESTYSSPEEFLAAKIAKKEIDPKSLSQTFQFKNQTYKVSDFDDVIYDNLPKILTPMSVEEAKQFAQNYLVAKSYVIKSDTQSLQKKVVMKNLEEMFGIAYGQPGNKLLKQKILECRTEQPQKFEQIEKIVQKVEQSKEIEGCKALAPGEHKVFTKKDAYTSGNYLLRRKSDGNYQAVLNVEFNNAGGGISVSKMMEKAKYCLSAASKSMKGPKGEKLELSILSPSEIQSLPDDQRPAVNKINIKESSYQTDAANYNDKVDCATITHETLHLLGLCDEYKETRPQFLKHNWTCRIVTKAPSIMRDLSFFQDAVPQKVTCDCSSTTCRSIMKSADNNIKTLYTTLNAHDAIPYKFRNEYCKNVAEDYVEGKSLDEPTKALLLRQDKGNTFVFENREIALLSVSPYYSILKRKISCSCPSGDSDCLSVKASIFKVLKSNYVKSSCPVESKQISATEGTKSNVVEYSNGVLTLNSRPTAPSLLQPSHFNKILTGNCPGAADKYNECAAFAYQGEPCSVPASCRSDDYYLGSPQ